MRSADWTGSDHTRAFSIQSNDVGCALIARVLIPKALKVLKSYEDPEPAVYLGPLDYLTPWEKLEVPEST